MAKFIEFTLDNTSGMQKNTALLNLKACGITTLNAGGMVMGIYSIPRQTGTYTFVIQATGMDQSYVDAINDAILTASRTDYTNAIIPVDPNFTFGSLNTFL